jgi:restriction endonuclease S subunit
VGLEHLDPENLHIRRWGKGSDVEGVKLRFYKGDIIFGRRRAYQRKLAVAEMDGICSAHAMVLRGKPELCLPEFLPFLMMSDAFMKRAVEISVGSLSPTISWGVLKQQPFTLPPMDQQRRIAELLWAVDENLSAHSKVLEDTLVALASVFDSNADPKHGEHWQSVPLDRVVAKFIDYRGKTPVKTLSGVPLITARNVREGFLSEEPREFIAADDYDAWMRRGIPQAGDVLFTTEAPLGNVARIPTHDFALAQRIICLRPNAEVVEPDYFFWAMQSSHTKRKILERAHGTTVNGIKQSNLRQVLFPLPDRKVQLQVAEQCEALTRVKLASEAHLHSVGQMRSALLQEIFSQS